LPKEAYKIRDGLILPTEALGIRKYVLTISLAKPKENAETILK
jgi:hypothetical protein